MQAKYMEPEGENNIVNIVQNIPNMPSRDSDQPAGTVVSADGTRVTLGDEVPVKKPARHTNGGTNFWNMKF